MQIKAKEIKIVKLADIKLNPKNRNKHPKDQIDEIAKIIKYQGFRRPVTISNRTGFLNCGEGRYLASKQLGISEIPAIFQDYDDAEQEFADAIADNALDKWAELDIAGINEDLDGLSADFDLDMMGIKDFQRTENKDEPQCDEDEIPETTETRCKLGQIWKLGEHRVMCGDSTDLANVEKLMNGDKADMVFTDPPYGVDYEGINNDSRKGLGLLLEGAFLSLSKNIKKGGSVYCFHSDKCADIFHSVWHKYFHLSSINIWVKPSLVMGGSDYQSRHEPCFYGWEKSEKHKWYSDRKQTSVWDFGRDKVKEHTTPKPVDLVSYCIKNSSAADSLVIDIFLGSGSTLIACEKTARKCYGMELDPHYCDVILTRWETYTGKKAELISE